MATITIPRLVGKTNKSRLTSWYWQPSKTLRAKGWKAEPLGDGGSRDNPPLHIVDQAKARNEKVDGSAELPIAALRKIQRPLTVDQGIQKFRDAGYPSVRKPGFLLDKATADQYEKKFKVIEKWGKGVTLSSVTDDRVAKLRDALMLPAASGRYAGQVRHHHAHETLRVGRALWHWFEQQRFTPRGTNPFSDFGLSVPDPRQEIWWPPARELVLSVAADTDEGLELAIDLAFSIGPREADLLRLQISQYQEIPHYKLDPEVWEQLAEPDATGRRCVMGIRLRQNKGKRWVEVPVVGETRSRVEAQIARAKAADMTCLLFDKDNGLPWTMPNLKNGQRRFIRRFGEVRQWAIDIAKEDGNTDLATEIGELQFRDFRRTAVVYQGELGIADQLISAITGHTLDETKQILETYMPRTTGMAARAIALSQARSPAPKQEQSK